MKTLEIVLFLLIAVTASSILEKVIPRLSLPLVQVALGALIAAFFDTPFSGGIDSELLLILFIAPLHFNESRHADSGALWANRWGIASLAVGLVFAIVLSVGFTLHALLPAIPLAAALAFGAAMGSTDAVAVTELSKDFRFGRRHSSLLTGEAFFNDVTGTVVFQCAIGVAVSGAFSLVHAGEEFALDMFGGLFGGAIMGFLAWALLSLIRRLGIDGPTLHVTLELLIPFVIFLVAKQIHIGGVIAVVAAGMVMSLMPHKRTPQTAKQQLQSRSVWRTINFILNGVIFVILGMQLPRVLHPVADGGFGNPLLFMGIVFVLTVILELVRFVWILGMDAVSVLRTGKSWAVLLNRKSLKSTLAMAFAGPKGGITLSLMLTIPASLPTVDGIPVREALISLASGVILCTLLLANFAVPVLVPHKHATVRAREKSDAEIALLQRVIQSIKDDAHKTGMIKSDSGNSCCERNGSINSNGASSDGENVNDGGACSESAAGGGVVDGSASGEIAVKADGESFDLGEEMADEPATVIVMKRYSERMEELVKRASPDVAANARKTINECNAAYEKIDELAERLKEMDSFDEDLNSESGELGLAAHLKAMQIVSDAVDDVQSQALTRELEFIKQMRHAGELDSEHAKVLRNDVYIQQIVA